MSIVLLDTHVLLWALSAPERIGPHATELIERSTRRYVSSVSFAEIEIKQLSGKLTVPERLPEVIAQSGFTELPLSAAHALALGVLPTSLSRHDPFDRLLLAQSATEEALLMTADRRLLDCGGLPVFDAAR